MNYSSQPTHRVTKKIRIKQLLSDQTQIKNVRRHPLIEANIQSEQSNTSSNIYYDINNPEEFTLDDGEEIPNLNIDLSKQIPQGNKGSKLLSSIDDLIKYYKNKEHQPTKFLDRHEIKPTHRSKMIDWMIEIFEEYHLNFSSYFLSISIMDTYCQNTTNILKLNDLHLLGVASIYISSQFNDVVPLNLVNAQDICYKKFTKEVILTCQIEILKGIKMEIDISNSFLFSTLLLNIITHKCTNNDEIPTDSFDQNKLIEASFYVLKHCLYDYNIITTYSQSQLGCGVVYFVSQIMKENIVLFPLNLIVDIILQKFAIGIDTLREMVTVFSQLMKNFTQLFDHSNNLRLYNSYAQFIWEKLQC